MSQTLDILFNVAPIVVTASSAICAVFPKPKEGSFLSKIFKLVNFLALNVGKAGAIYKSKDNGGR